MNHKRRIASFLKIFLSPQILVGLILVLGILVNYKNARAQGSVETGSFSEYKPDLGVERPQIKGIEFLDDQGQVMDPSIYQSGLTLKVGEDFDVKRLADDAETLRKNHPQFISITTRIEPFKKGDQNSVKIVFEFLRKRFIQYLRVKAPSHIVLDQKAMAQLRSKPGRLLRGEELKPDEEFIRKQISSLGYPKVKVRSEVKVLDLSRGTVELLFHVELGGGPYKVSKINFKGRKSVTEEVLAAAIQTKPAGGWSFSNMFNFISGEEDHFNESELQNDALRIAEEYKNRGFADVKVDSKFQVVETNKVIVSFSIEEGKRYTIQRIDFEGNKSTSRAQLMSLIGFKEGSPYSGKSFRTAMQKFREHYGERGYASMHVHFDFDVKTKSLKIRITEGLIQYIDRIEITGHESIEEKLIRSYFKMKEGDRVNTQLIADAIEALRKTNMFEEVQVNYLPQKPNAGKVVVSVKEAKKASVDVGFGYGSASGLQGDIGYSLRRSGMDFSVRAMQSEEETKLMLLFKNPRFLDTKNDLVVGAGYQDLDYGGFSKESIQARVVLEREIIKNLTIGVGSRIEFIGIHDIAPGMPIEVYDAAAKRHLVAGLVSTLVYNQEKVDASGEAYDGYKIRMAMLPSFADEDIYLKASATILAHKTLAENADGKKHILSGRLTLGYATNNTPFYDGMYTGGSAVLRGSSRGTLNPVGSSLPGKAVIGAGTYYSFPLYGEMFRGVAFMEGLSVGRGISDLGNVRVVGGVGVRANMMNSFLRTNIEGGFVFPAIKQTGDTFKPFYLMLGNYHPMYDL